MVEEGSKQNGKGINTYGTGTVLCPFDFYGTEAWDLQVKASCSASHPSS
jgi:hypothetical protein